MQAYTRLTAVKIEWCALPFPFRRLLCYVGILAVFPTVNEAVLSSSSYYGWALQLHSHREVESPRKAADSWRATQITNRYVAHAISEKIQHYTAFWCL